MPHAAMGSRARRSGTSLPPEASVSGRDREWYLQDWRMGRGREAAQSASSKYDRDKNRKTVVAMRRKSMKACGTVAATERFLESLSALQPSRCSLLDPGDAQVAGEAGDAEGWKQQQQQKQKQKRQGRSAGHGNQRGKSSRGGKGRRMVVSESMESRVRGVRTSTGNHPLTSSRAGDATPPADASSISGNCTFGSSAAGKYRPVSRGQGARTSHAEPRASRSPPMSFRGTAAAAAASRPHTARDVLETARRDTLRGAGAGDSANVGLMDTVLRGMEDADRVAREQQRRRDGGGALRPQTSCGLVTRPPSQPVGTGMMTMRASVVSEETDGVMGKVLERTERRREQQQRRLTSAPSRASSSAAARRPNTSGAAGTGQSMSSTAPMVRGAVPVPPLQAVSVVDAVRRSGILASRSTTAHSIAADGSANHPQATDYVATEVAALATALDDSMVSLTRQALHKDRTAYMDYIRPSGRVLEAEAKLREGAALDRALDDGILHSATQVEHMEDWDNTGAFGGSSGVESAEVRRAHLISQAGGAPSSVGEQGFSSGGGEGGQQQQHAGTDAYTFGPMDMPFEHDPAKSIVAAVERAWTSIEYEERALGETFASVAESVSEYSFHFGVVLRNLWARLSHLYSPVRQLLTTLGVKLSLEREAMSVLETCAQKQLALQEEEAAMREARLMDYISHLEQHLDAQETQMLSIHRAIGTELSSGKCEGRFSAAQLSRAGLSVDLICRRSVDWLPAASAGIDSALPAVHGGGGGSGCEDDPSSFAAQVPPPVGRTFSPFCAPPGSTGSTGSVGLEASASAVGSLAPGVGRTRHPHCIAVVAAINCGVDVAFTGVDDVGALDKNEVVDAVCRYRAAVMPMHVELLQYRVNDLELMLTDMHFELQRVKTARHHLRLKRTESVVSVSSVSRFGAAQGGGPAASQRRRVSHVAPQSLMASLPPLGRGGRPARGRDTFWCG